tara:strand:- start:547 stop:822 length:276 start_codon:yes stop_codon:yes gene_type:complete
VPEEKEFPTGFFVSPPRPTAPGFVKGRISIKREDFMAYLSGKDSEWLRIDVKQGFKTDDAGNPTWYAQTDNWRPPSERVEEKEDSDDALPF